MASATPFTFWQTRLIAVLCVLGIGLRFVAMDRSYWLDEVVTVLNVSVANWKTVLIETSHDNQPPLYNLAAFAWTHVVGTSEIGVRSLSLLFGLLALFTPWLARTALVPNEKLLNFAILCVMTFPIRYAQEARNYSLLFLLSSACLYAYYEANAGRERRTPWLLYGCIALLAFTHIFGVMLALSFVAAMVWRDPSVRRKSALVLFGVALAAAAVGPLLLGGAAKQAGGNFWIKFSAKVVGIETLKLLTPAGIAILAYGLVRWRMSPVRARIAPALMWSLLPYIMMALGAVVISLHTPIFTAQYLIGLIPAYALTVCWFLRPEVSGSKPAVAVVMCALLLLQAVALTFSPYLFVQENLRLIAETSRDLDRRVCYVMPAGSTDDLSAVWSFYISRRLGRPDLKPIVVPEADLPQALADNRCELWAEGHLSKRGVSLLGQYPALATCRNVPLGKPGIAMASELLDCRSVRPEPPPGEARAS